MVGNGNEITMSEGMGGGKVVGSDVAGLSEDDDRCGRTGWGGVGWGRGVTASRVRFQ